MTSFTLNLISVTSSGIGKPVRLGGKQDVWRENRTFGEETGRLEGKQDVWGETGRLEGEQDVWGDNKTFGGKTGR